MNMAHHVYLSLGSNLGNKERNLRTAIQLIEKQIGRITGQSAFYISEPWRFDSQNGFVNCVICIDTPLSPFNVLTKTQNIEREMGRTHKSINGIYHDRLIDIDILLYDDIRLQTAELTIPHPLMHLRDFVMIPLKEIAPEIALHLLP